MIKINTLQGKINRQFKNSLYKGFLLLFLFIGFTTISGQTKTTVTTAGTTSFTTPTGVTGITVQLWGAGGAGGGSGSNKRAGSGGGGGAYSFSNTITVAPGTIYSNSIVVGAGGVGALSVNGTNGANSSINFGTLFSANGGKGGAGNATNTSPIGDGGAAGTHSGGNGGSGIQGVNGPGGGGGSSAGIAVNGNNGTSSTAGAAVTDGGAGGSAGAQSVNGSPGSNPGGGGGGGGDTAGSNNTAGGNGGVGQAIISYFLLAGTANTTVCNSATATIRVTGTTTNLPVGTYTVTYDLASPNASTNNSATMTVATAGIGTFSTVTLSNAGSTGITITSIAATLTGITYKTSYDNTGNANNKATITVSSNNTVGAASSTPTLCINTVLTNITHTTTGATGIGTATGLPTGVSAAWASNTITISGTPTASGTFNYTIPLTGGCASVNATGTITVSANNTAGAASSTPTLCINTALTNITHATTGATGIGAATGLPSGVTAAWATNTITISGTPTASGTFNYSIPLTGGCGSVNATGTITVLINTAGAASSTPTLCINTALTNITHATTGATGIGSPTGLPSGVSASWASNTITISGTPTASGTFNYSIPLTGGCGSINATGTITVSANNTAGAASSTPTLCINTALTNITRATTGATGIGSPTNLPSGVTAAWASNTITISGTPTASGIFNYTIPLTGGCASVNATGTITVSANNTAGSASSTPTLCINTALTNITHATTGATGIGSPTNLPSGVTAAWASNTITISGTPTASGTFNYSIPLTGGCGSVNATGTITVRVVFTSGAIETTGETICYNGNPTLGIGSLTNASGGDGSITYVWQANGVNIPGSNAETFDPPPGLTVTTTYTRFAKDNTCNPTFTLSTGSWVVTISNANTWTGGTSTAWNTASNWSCGIVPIPATDVTIGTSTYDPVISSDVTINSLTINSGETLIVVSDYDLTVTGSIANSGTFTMNNNANLLQGGSSNTNTGNIVVKRNSSALIRLDYTLWSSPVTGQGLYAFSPFTFANRFYIYDTATNLYSNSVGFNITGLNSNGVNGTDNNGVQFVQAKGYLIRTPWNHPTAAIVWNGTFTGVPNNGNVTLAMTTGYNAVGNPYPSRVNVHNFIDGNANISGPLYFWRKTNDTSTTSYSTLTKTAYVANGAAGGDTGTLYFNFGDEANWVINIGQGFIVNATSSSNVSFTNSMRRSLNANQFFKTTQPTTNSTNSGLYWLNLNTDNGIYSQMAVGYSSEGTLAEDRGIDGKNINPEFYLTSLIGTDEYSIQGRPDFQLNDIVPLSYKVATAANFTISIDHTAGLFNETLQSIYLKDNLTTAIHDLNTGAYSFTSTAGTFSDRFEIVYALPLGIHHPIFTANNVVVYNQDNEFVVNAGNIIMSSVKVFDIRGRLLQERKGINASQTSMTAGLTNQVLLVQITSEDGITVTKKVIR